MTKWLKPTVSRVAAEGGINREPRQTGIALRDSAVTAIGRFVRRYEIENRPLHVIQIGAGDGSTANDPLQQWIIKRSSVHAHLVEAAPHLHQRLSSATADQSPRIQCHCLAVSRHGGRRSFHYVSPDFAENNPDEPAWKQIQIGSLSDTHLRTHVPAEYVISNEIDSRSPASLLEEIGLAGCDLELLVVDAEAFDGEIVLGFLEVSRPELIIYEHNLMPAGDREELLDRLKHLDYVTWMSGYDHIAAQRRLLVDPGAESTAI